MTWELATVEQVVDRNRYAGCTLAAAQTVLPAVAAAIGFAETGPAGLHEALMALSMPLFAFTPISDILCWFNPPMINQGLHQLAGGNLCPLGEYLDTMGLLPQVGVAYARAREVRERVRAGL